jgi:predicted nucleic acid-binding protein
VSERLPVICLLDINVLLAMAYRNHVHHHRVYAWLNVPRNPEQRMQFATCAITELGFVRVACGRVALAPDIASARWDLLQLKDVGRFVFLNDERTAECLPDWVSKSEQTTDGHLLELATSYGGRFVTLDRGIPGADLVPELLTEPLMVRDPCSPAGRIVDPDTSDALGDPPLGEIIGVAH